ncbi:MAG: hypothetical protein HC769_12950 [Cyanobacteria bacterium CRU_2_1]|nr:hypothetical protein [Cyanobacteria bacterium CRU_2_1]
MNRFDKLLFRVCIAFLLIGAASCNPSTDTETPEPTISSTGTTPPLEQCVSVIEDNVRVRSKSNPNTIVGNVTKDEILVLIAELSVTVDGQSEPEEFVEVKSPEGGWNLNEGATSPENGLIVKDLVKELPCK